uniref:Protein argonaute 2-like n=1 Tax=Nicotiana tabacum TaxID=4097 RepID=A0A1S3YJ86_TOBAC|nr:PREDICTED: protein argonaute 2-like [Nicotiana tabacum]
MILPNWELEDTHDDVGEGKGEGEGRGEGGGEDEGEGEGRNIRGLRYVASRGRPRLNRYRGRIDSYFRSSQTGGRSGVRGNIRGRSGGRGSGRGVGRSGGRGGGRDHGSGGGNTEQEEGIEIKSGRGYWKVKWMHEGVEGAARMCNVRMEERI